MEHGEAADRAKRGADEGRQDERRSRRIPLEIEVSLTSESQFYSGITGNISEGGLFVATYHRPPIGNPLEIELTLPSGTFRARGIVRWVRDTQEGASPGLGIEFEDLSEEMRNAIEDFLSERPPLLHDVDDS